MTGWRCKFGGHAWGELTAVSPNYVDESGRWHPGDLARFCTDCGAISRLGNPAP